MYITQGWYASLQRDHGETKSRVARTQVVFLHASVTEPPPPLSSPPLPAGPERNRHTHTHTIPKPAPVRSAPGSHRKRVGEWAGGPRPRCAQNAHAQLPHGFRLTDDYTGLDQCLTPLSKPHEFSRLLGAFELEKGHYLGPWRTCSLSTEHRREGFSQCRDVSAVESVFSQPKLVCFSSSLGVWECICSARVRGVCVLLGCMSLSPPTRHSARAH
jgi:hypothetical protein